MANELKAEIVFDPIFGPQAKKKVEKQAEKAGDSGGKKFTKKFNKNVESNIGKNLKRVLRKRIELPALNVKAAFVGVAGAAAAAFGTRAIVNAAKIQEDSINQLNTALKLSGQFTKQASQDFQDFASSLQQQSKFGDEAILQNAALLQSLGRLSTDGLKEATQASLDLAAGLGINLQSAVTLVGKAAAGEVGSFSRYGIIVKKGADNAETFRRVLDKLQKQFGGAAAAQLATFSGATTAASNAFGDLQEELGFTITQNAKVIGGVKAAKEGFETLSKFVRDNQNALKALVAEGFAALVGAISFVAQGVIKTAEAFVTLKGAIDDIGNTAIIDDLSAQLAEAERLSVESADRSIREESRKQAERLRIAIEATDRQIANEQAEAQRKIQVLEGFAEQVRTIGEGIADAKPVITPEVTPPPPPPGEEGPTISPVDQKALDSLTLFGVKLQSVDAKGKEFALNWQKVGAQVKNTAVQGIGRGIGQGFAAVGQALAKGENALAAFGKAFAAAIGQAAVQLGQRFILEGIAISFNPLLGGPSVGGPLIAAGAALATFGGVLGGALSGGGGGAAAGGAPASPGEQAVAESPIIDQVEEREEQEQRLQVVFQGDFLDTPETGSKIIESINQAFELNGNVITNGSFA